MYYEIVYSVYDRKTHHEILNTWSPKKDTYSDKTN